MSARRLFAEAAATRLSELRDARRRRRAGPGDLRHRQHQRGPGGAPGQRRLLRHLRPGPRHPAPGEAWPRPEAAQALTSDYEALVGQRRFTAVRCLRDQRRGRLAADGLRDAAGLPDPAHRDERPPRRVAAPPDPGPGSAQAHRPAEVAAGEPDRGGRGGPSLLLLWYLLPHPLWDATPRRRNTEPRGPALGPRRSDRPAAAASSGPGRCGTGVAAAHARACCGPRPSGT